ncbi:UNVERIFIED_CONTAM: chitin deacetylase [Siphonaria sp. JEL0065]|nr:chitin deacetylase [Siphonaria sp. JEL0065]
MSSTHDFSWAPSKWSLAPSVPVWTQYFNQVNPIATVPDDIWTCTGSNPKAWMPSFDDGPSPYTHTVSEYFSNKGLTTTFFTIGSNVLDYPDEMLKAYKRGHEIAIHTWSHPNMTSIKEDNQIISELVYSARAIYEVIGKIPKYYRPPFGQSSQRVRRLAATMGLISVLYIDSHDWEFDNDATKINQVVPGNFKNWINQGLKNQISLEHDIYATEVAVMSTAMDMLVNAGYDLEPLSKCVGDSSPYGNSVLEGFFKSGQFDNKKSLVLPSDTSSPSPSVTTVSPTPTTTNSTSTIGTTDTTTYSASSTYVATVNTVKSTTSSSSSILLSLAPRATSTNATSKPGNSRGSTSGKISSAQPKPSPTTPRKLGSSHTSSSTIAPAAEPKSTKISNRSTPKAILDLGVGSHHKTAFSAAYSKGGFPCRLEHGSVKHKISWSQPVSTLSYNPLFVTLMEGLRETKHPFLFLVPNALKELILAPNARSKIEPIMAQSVPPLRNALSSKEKSTILAALATVHSLGTCMGACMLPYLAALLPPIALHSHSRDTQIKDSVIACLQGVESGIAFNSSTGANDGECKRVEVQSATGTKEKKVVNVGEWIGVGGGDRGVGGADGAEALKLIKSKIPTYSSVFG